MAKVENLELRAEITQPPRSSQVELPHTRGGLLERSGRGKSSRARRIRKNSEFANQEKAKFALDFILVVVVCVCSGNQTK